MDKDKNTEDIIDNATEEVIKETVDAAVDEVDEDEKVEVIDETEKKIAEAEAKAAENLDKYQRLMAEFYNFRERTSKEKASMYNDGAKDTIEKLLPVIDNLERAIAAQKDKADENDAFFKGVEMILKNFKEILKSIGVEEIPALGEKFDPNVHAAVSHIDDENFGENEVSLEMLKGYKYKDKVLRHSMVQVAN